MDRNTSGIVTAIAFIIFATGMGGLNLLMTGFSEQFGYGVGVGIVLGMGLLGLASRQVRDAP